VDESKEQSPTARQCSTILAGAPNNNAAIRLQKPRPERSRFFAFLRHPLRKPAEADLRRPVCKNKPCPCLPSGKDGGCVVSLATNDNRWCRRGEYWSGGGCATLSPFRLNDCSDLALALDRQARQAQLAEGGQWTVCSRGAGSRVSPKTKLPATNTAAAT